MTEQVDLDALEALAKAADNWGGWAIWPDLTEGGFVHVGNEDGVIPEGQIATPDDAEANPIAKAYTPEIGAFIAAADPATVLALIAELRQERERADEAANHAELALAGRRDAVDALARERERADALSREAAVSSMGEFDDLHTALSRAEGTIESVRLYCENQGDKFRYHAGRILDAITEYDKQKGADRG